MNTKPKVIIIGAGFTGCALAYDLTLRGCEVIVLERGDIANGTSGRTHGLLHSGGRYCVSDQEAASECIQENILLRKISKQCIEFNGGLFIAMDESDMAYSEHFASGAEKCGIPIERLSKEQIIKLEPNITPEVIFGYSIPDGSFDPLRLAMGFAASAVVHHAQFFTYHEVVGFVINGTAKLSAVEVINRHSGEKQVFECDLCINATGAWAGKVSEMAGITVPVLPTPGVMVSYGQRVTQRVINRLCKPDDGDIIIPQRRMSVIGTTSFEVENADYIPIEKEQVEKMNQRAAKLVPLLKNVPMRGVYMSARPLIGGSSSGRSLSRTFKCYDHKESDGFEGFVTITGGKATTCRVMAEKTADLVCKKLGVSAKCETQERVLADYHEYYPFN